MNRSTRRSGTGLWAALVMLLAGLLAFGCSGSAGEDTGYADPGGDGVGGAGDDTYYAGTGGGAETGTSTEGGGSPQSWQKTTDDVLFPSVSLGGGVSLELRKMRVTARSEGLRTRTLVDHIFYNPVAQSVEGTFRYPLPPEASVSYFAMFPGTTGAEPDFFGPADPLLGLPADQLAAEEPDTVVQDADTGVWGAGKVAKVVRAVDATKAYEQETKQKIDPALAEPVAPNSFRARIFPIPANGFIRIVVAYEQTLPRVGAELEYAFPVAKGAIESLDFTLTASSSAVSAVSSVGDLAAAPADDPDGFTYTTTIAGQSAGGTIKLRLTAAGGSDQADVLTGTDPGTQQSFFYARLHPTLSGLPAAEGGSSQAVFLVDTSLSERPDQFNVNRQLIKGILEGSPELLRFNVLTFDASARWLSAGWVNNDAAGRAQILGQLDQILLEGATDFSSALRALASSGLPVGADKRLDAFVLSDGVVNWGESTIATMIGRYEADSPFQTRFFAYRTGLAAENLDLFRALTRHGAIFNCYSAADLPACTTAHKATGVQLSSVTVEGVGANGAVTGNLLIAGRQATLFPGAELTVAGRLLQPGPAVVHFVGKTRASNVDFTVPVTLTPAGSLAPRAWAEIGVGQLLDTHDAALEGIAMALSQRYRIPSRVASMLVLDSNEKYTEYNLEDETAKFSGQSISTLVEASLAKLGTAWTTWSRLHAVLTDYDDVNHLSTVDGGNLVSTIQSLVSPQDLELPISTLVIPAVLTSEVPTNYVSSLTHDATVQAPFIDEAERRHGDGDTGGAVRALSNLVENDPSNAETERLIGYRVASWDQAAEASALFLHVLERRPFEPPSYRDLANSLGTTRPAISAMLFEAAIAGTFDQKYGQFRTIIREEYALFMEALAKQSPTHPLNAYLAERKSALHLTTPKADLRVVLTWNTDNVDIDLWVTDPHGEKCYYANPHIASGGVLLDDETQGYGPERFQAVNALSGGYKVQAHYYGNHSDQLFAETFINVAIMTHLGTPQQKVERFNAVLHKENEVVTIETVHFD